MAYQFQGPGVQGGTARTTTAQKPAASERRRPAGRELVQLFALAVGAVFLLVGVLGFVPGVTTPFDDFGLFGTDSEAKLLGLFQVSVLHNVVHLLFGVAGLAAAARPRSAGTFLVGGGILYLGVWLYGVLIDKTSDLNFLPLNTNDDYLHLGLSLGMIALGVIGTGLWRRRAIA